VIAIYEQHKTAVFNYIYYRIGGDQGLAEDFTADVFLRMLTHIHTFTYQNRPIRAWLYTIARNLINDHYRASKKVRWVLLNEAKQAPGTAFEQQIHLDMRSKHLVQAISHLTNGQQEVIILRFVEGLSVAETAAIMGKRKGAVKTLTRRALAALRRVLEREGAL
jgi:RNA polymerase sigma-70 factor (ECF subfamily)